MSKPPINFYFIRTPNGPGGPEYHIRLEDDRWSADEDMTPLINDSYPQTGTPTTYFNRALPSRIGSFRASSHGGGTGPGVFLAAPTPVTLLDYDLGTTPSTPPVVDYHSTYKVSHCKRIGYFPINSLALNTQPFKKITYKNATTGGIMTDGIPFRSEPVLNFNLNLLPAYADDPVFHSDFPLFNALDRDTLFDDEGNEYFPDTFWQVKGGPLQAWVYQELLGSNLPIGDGTARWRWREVYNEHADTGGSGPFANDNVLSSGSFQLAIRPGSTDPILLPGIGYTNVQTMRIATSGGPANSCEYFIRLEYSPDGTRWPTDAWV